MKNLMLTIAIAIFGMFLSQEVEAQVTITNNTDGDYIVKVNHVPAGMGFTGAGPLIRVLPFSTRVIGGLPAPGMWIPGFGVEDTGIPLPKYVCGDAAVGLPPINVTALTSATSPNPVLIYGVNSLTIDP